MDPRTMLFKMSAPRPLIEDEDERGLNCYGCLFHKQRAAVCRVASEQAVLRQMRDCDAVDQFGEVVIYLATDVDPRQMDLIGE